jgi:hypothetical protein
VCHNVKTTSTPRATPLPPYHLLSLSLSSLNCSLSPSPTRGVRRRDRRELRHRWPSTSRWLLGREQRRRHGASLQAGTRASAAIRTTISPGPFHTRGSDGGRRPAASLATPLDAGVLEAAASPPFSTPPCGVSTTTRGFVPQTGGVPAVLRASVRRVHSNQGLGVPSYGSAASIASISSGPAPSRPASHPRLRTLLRLGARCPRRRLRTPAPRSTPLHLPRVLPQRPRRPSARVDQGLYLLAAGRCSSPLHACCSGRPASEQARLQLLQPRALAASPVGASSSTKDFGRVARSLAVGVSCSFPAPYGGAAASPRPGARPPASPAHVKRRRACAACPRPSASAAVRASAQRPGHTSPAAGASLQMPRPALLLLARPLRFRVRLSPANLAELRFRVRLSNVKPGARASRASLRPQHERACLSSGQWPRPYASAGYLARPLKVLAFILLLICTRLCLWFAFMYEDLICFHILSMKHCRYVGGYILNT